MSRSTPSLLALLGLVAVAGYQNRDRISEMMADARQKMATPGAAPPAGGGGLLSEIGQFFKAGPTGASAVGTTVSNALSDLVEKFKSAGRGATADSWVSATEPNQPINTDDLEAALGPDTLDELAGKTGLSRAEVLSRLKVALPEVVNRFTPNGRLPTFDESQHLA